MSMSGRASASCYAGAFKPRRCKAPGPPRPRSNSRTLLQAQVVQLPVLTVISCIHPVTDMTLGMGSVTRGDPA